MRSWKDRTVEEANLFNPAFSSTLIAATVDSYSKATKRPLPFPLAFIVLPIILHAKTRSDLPRSTATALLPWIQSNPELIAGFGERVIRLRSVSREALLFGTLHGTLAISGEGGLAVGAERRAPTEKRTALFTLEARECVERASFVGRWLAPAGGTATIFSSWGIAP